MCAYMAFLKTGLPACTSTFPNDFSPLPLFLHFIYLKKKKSTYIKSERKNNLKTC